jgi:hypothetical protein
VHTTLGDALQACREDLPAVLALHSGPSKSADIGQILVTGVHGPGRIIAAILGADAADAGTANNNRVKSAYRFIISLPLLLKAVRA